MPPEISKAKTEILCRIAAANENRKLLTADEVEDARVRLPRNYRMRGTMLPAGVLALLERRLRDYGAGVARCPAKEVAHALSGILQQHSVRSMALPGGFSSEWLPAGVELLNADTMSARDLDRCDGVLTGATVAIAETGTLVLQAVAGQGRRAVTLVPDYHLCVVRVADVMETVPEAFLRIDPTKTLPTTFVSGPSATADIEMTRIKGVHGPRFLDVLLVG